MWSDGEGDGRSRDMRLLRVWENGRVGLGSPVSGALGPGVRREKSGGGAGQTWGDCGRARGWQGRLGLEIKVLSDYVLGKWEVTCGPSWAESSLKAERFSVISYSLQVLAACWAQCCTVSLEGRWWWEVLESAASRAASATTLAVPPFPSQPSCNVIIQVSRKLGLVLQNFTWSKFC